MMELTSVTSSTSDGNEAGNNAAQVIKTFEPSGNENGDALLTTNESVSSNINSQSGRGLYFRKVCENGDLKNLKKLLKLEEKIDFNEPDEHGQTGLFLACWKGHFQVVKFLVEQSQDLGLDLNKANKDGMTPFHTACLNQQAKIVCFLMESEYKYGINYPQTPL